MSNIKLQNSNDFTSEYNKNNINNFTYKNDKLFKLFENQILNFKSILNTKL